MSFQNFNSLYFFERVAEHLSFKHAAQELHLTQSALSHRIRKLEQELGFKLFVRHTRKITLTEEGKRLYQQISQNFSLISNEINDISQGALHGELSIGSTPTFAQHWLAPRLIDFYRLYPQLNLQICSKGSRVDFNLHPAELWIDYGDGHYPHLSVTHLMDEVLMPVCSPNYAERMKLWDHPDRLQECLLLHNVESIEQTDRQSEWRGWLANHDLQSRSLNAGYSFTHYDSAIIAACSGLGVAMGRYQLARPLVERGELVFPFDSAYNQNLGYYAVTRNEFSELARVKAFCQWLKDQLEA